MDKLNALAARAMGWVEEWQEAQGYQSHDRENPIGVMWWKGEGGGVFRRYKFMNKTYGDWQFPNFASAWVPSQRMDDALILLDRISAGGKWSVEHPSKRGRIFNEYATDDGLYRAWCELENGDSKYASWAKTAPLAMTLCALRAAGIPESEITAAMEE